MNCMSIWILQAKGKMVIRTQRMDLPIFEQFNRIPVEVIARINEFDVKIGIDPRYITISKS